MSECVDLFTPDRRCFEYALAEVGCAPGEAVMIGDRLDNDISPAKSIGMKTVRIVQGLYSVQKAESGGLFADREINKLSELLEIEF
ncbi:MAG: HAD family hydrolase [Oscillospiraceae bacterium]|nr:HAD family hydrolase [Oscillospiraceae bacterium]